jgi:protease-4
MVELRNRLPALRTVTRRLTGRPPEGEGARSGLLLELDLTEAPLVAPPSDPLAAARARRRTTLRDIEEGLDRGAQDPAVVGLVARLGASMGVGTAQDVRAAVLAFRQSGKPAVAYAETFGEFGPGTLSYYVATAFDAVWLQPSGDVVLPGLHVDALFLRDALDRIGVRAQVARRHEYKNAADTLLETGFTPAHREAITELVGSLAAQLAQGVASGRGLPVQRARELLGAGPVLGADAQAAGLVDRLGYRDEVLSAVRRRVDAPAELKYVSRYRRSPAAMLRKLATRSEPAVAVVHAHGAVRLGRSGRSPLAGAAFGSDTVSGALRAAVREDRVRAVVLRVDSPGGSYVASDTVWREVARTRAAGLPVVVSMGDVAASGGYFVAMGADVIIAQPGTITGSIGVLGGKIVRRELAEKLGIRHDSLGEGANASMFSAYRPYTDDQWLLVNRWLDRIYDDFTAKVAAGRGLDIARVHEVARGRVWTGAQARDIGLVDDLGGLPHAVSLARQRAGLAADAPVVDLPSGSPLERLRPPHSSDDVVAAASGALWGPSGLPGAVTAALDELRAEAWGPLSGLAARMGMPAGGPLLLPWLPRLR